MDNSVLAFNDVLGDFDTASRRSAIGASSGSSASIVDPAKVALDVFGFEFNLASREQLIAQLELKVPLEGDRSSTVAASSSPRTGVTIVGDFSASHLAATMLQETLPRLTDVGPLDSSSVGTCDHRPLLPLIANAVGAIVIELSKPEGPLSDSVNNLLGILCGYNKDATPMNVKNVGGLFGEYVKRCGLNVDVANACSVTDEAVLTAFSNVLAVNNMLLQAWTPVQAGGGGKYFSIVVPRFIRNLQAIVLDLEQLHDLVPGAAWMTSQLKAEPRVMAWDLYQWIYKYASEGARRDLQDGGKDAIGVVKKTIDAMKTLLDATLLNAKPDPKKRCTGIAVAFTTADVQAALNETSCHMQNVINVAAELGA